MQTLSAEQSAAVQAELTAGNLPAQFITPWGQVMTAVGRGCYPYYCDAKKNQPNAMIYHGPGSWSGEYSYEFTNRNADLDVARLPVMIPDEV